MRRGRRLTLRGAALAAAFALSCARVPTRGARPPARTADGDAAALAARPSQPQAAKAPEVDGAPAPSARAADLGATTGQDGAPPTAANVRDAVSSVASGGGLPAYGTPQALHAIAAMLESVAAGSSPAMDAIRRMRAQVEALARLGAIDLERADRIKDALERGSEALREFSRAHASRWLDPWVDAAAAAVDAVDPETPLGLQRAAVQDALRTLADAVLVAEQFGRQ